MFILITVKQTNGGNMNITTTSNKIINAIGDLCSHVVIAGTGSTYIHLTGCKVKYIRVANHTGHTPKAKTWQLRCDVSSSRKGTNRIYTDVNRLISDLIS